MIYNKQVLIVSKPFDNGSIQTWMDKNKHFDYTVVNTDEAAIEVIFRMDLDKVIVCSDDEMVNMKKLSAILNMQQPDAVVINYTGEDVDGITAKMKEATAMKRRQTNTRVIISDTLNPQNLASQIREFPILN